ncbi:thymidylate synthase [Candidatus Parcubacteria bacterium]|nr:thymidylate synthase [Candidatus Parcubacteria bacterium]
MEYKAFVERTPDTQYRELLSRILTEGEEVMPQQEEAARMIVGHQMRFDFSNGFPMVTERDLASDPPQWQLAIAELCAFLNGARTLEAMRAFGCGWWARWVTTEKCEKRGLEPGDLGPGSYGPAFHDFPMPDGGTFNQFENLVAEIRELPHLRTHFVSPWIPFYIPRRMGRQQKVVVAPCHGWVHVLINVVKGELVLHHFQRSADAPVGLVFNLIQYAALTFMLAQVTGYRAKTLVYTTSDTHIYERQIPDVEALLATPLGRFPTVLIDSSVRDLFDFRPHHFEVRDYHPQGPRRVIWTPV